MQMRESTLSMRTLASLVAAIGVIASGVAVGFFINDTTNTQEYADLVSRALSLAVLESPEDIHQLSASSTDLGTSGYEKIKHQLTRIKDAEPDVRFSYLLGRSADGTLFFYADSEDPTSPDYSPPGQTYDEASDLIKAGFDTPTGHVLEIYSDRWGNWISALAPISDASGTVVALIGLDKNANAHFQIFATQIALVVAVVVALLIMIALIYVTGRREQQLADMKTDFIALASHQLRSPLAAMRWGLAALQDDPSLTEVVRNTIKEIYATTRRLIDTTTAFLETVAVDHKVNGEDSMEQVDVAAIIRARITETQPLAATKEIAIEKDAALESPKYVHGNPLRIALVFDNLFQNAIKYSQNKSSIFVGYHQNHRSHVFTVVDHGIGIPHAELALVFAGFHRAANARKTAQGSGFGLYVVKKIVEFHSGTITCESQEGEGTTFSISLPALPAEAKA